MLDQPHPRLLENMRPILSHDEKEIRLKITNKQKESGNRSENIKVRGYSTFIFCTANYRQSEQEKTRLLILSPEHSQEKLREAIQLRIDKEGDRVAFIKRLANDPKRASLMVRVQNIKQANIDQVLIPESLRELIYRKFLEGRTFLQSRNQRDISRLMGILKGYALLNFHQRGLTENAENDTTSITATFEDVEVGFKYYSTISEANELGIPPEIYELYNTFKSTMNDYQNGFTRKDFQRMFYQVYHKFIGREKAKAFLEALETAEPPQWNSPTRWIRGSLDMCVAGVEWRMTFLRNPRLRLHPPYTHINERTRATLEYIRENTDKEGLVPIGAVLDKAALNQLLREGSVYEPREGFVKSTVEVNPRG